MSSFARILPFVKPLEHLLLDPTVTEVMVNAGGRRVFVEREGTLEQVPELVLDERNLKVAIKNIARTCGDEISEAQPVLDARLEDGSRVAAMFPPCSVNGPTLTIRKFTRRYSLQDLLDIGSLTPELTSQLQDAVRGRRNILISGGTGTGKTTLLNARSGSKRDARRRRWAMRRPCWPSPSRTCSARRCGIGPTASSWARCVVQKPLTYCRRSTPDTSAA